jgi:hypothetical protein
MVSASCLLHPKLKETVTHCPRMGHTEVGAMNQHPLRVGSVKDRPCGQGTLAMATVALEGLDLAVPVDAVAAALTRWADVSCWPAGLLQGCLTLGLYTIVSKKFIQTEASLKLEMVWRHGSLLIKSWNRHGNPAPELRQNLSQLRAEV